MAILSILDEVESIQQIKQHLDNPGLQLLTGVIDAQKSHISAYIVTNIPGPMVFVTYQERKAIEIQQDLTFFLPEEIPVRFFPAKDMLFYAADSRSGEIDRQRLEVLLAMAQNEKQVIVLSLDGLRDRFIPKNSFFLKEFHLELGQEIPISILMEQLIQCGYQRTDILAMEGQFSLRGGIIDIFSPSYPDAFRLEFWGDEIDSIRWLDEDNRLSVDSVPKGQQMHIFPVREFLLDEDSRKAGIKKFQTAWDKRWTVEMDKEGASFKKLETNIHYLLERMENEGYFPGIEKFISFFYEENLGLLDYMPDNTLIIWDEPTRLSQYGGFLETEFLELMTFQMENNEIFSIPPWVLSYNDMLQQLKNHPVLALSTLSRSVPDLKVKHIESMTVKSIQFTEKSVDGLLDELLYYEKLEYRMVILLNGEIKARRLVNELNKAGKTAIFMENITDAPLLPSQIIVTIGFLSSGFEYPLHRMVVISGNELFGEEKRKKRRQRRKDAKKIESFTDLQIGDYVVHDNHGIGVYQGIENVESAGIAADYLKISYADGGFLYVHTGQMDLIQKYIGGEGSRPKVNKLGRGDWLRAKAETRAAVKALAFDIVALEAKRAEIKGFSFSEDSVWQREFEEAFPYEATTDQVVAIEEMKADMESTAVMDRLICGDVGYGKTEVAIRGAFKAVQDSKQVAFLVPTTILGQQHFNTFTERFKDFPVTIELLSRFRTKAQQDEIIRKLQDGRVDIVIGTHRLLSKDVKFKDLGLLIVDEEQRFGVSHKEKLKLFKENVDVLTLTATPIPRTLHMSLSGIRAMSLLDEPPEERKPVQTYVLEDELILIREAIERELDRGGQVYYLFNRVRGIASETAKLQKLLPGAKIAYGHGQMNERALENVMMDFIEGDIDILVSTTIVETGLDIPNVNTIIITHADRMGLSQLYQLRGRVGRSHRLAYCYLLYQKDKVLTEIATKRLQTIREFTEFGSGFKIAMRDLEIRGAGDLLGAEQHGFMNTVGYETYSRILAEEVALLQGEPGIETMETAVELPIDAYIPSYYIESESEKLDMYKRLAYISSVEEKIALDDELLDMYGELPKVVLNLLDIALLKGLASKLGIRQIIEKQQSIRLYMEDDFKGDPVAITKAVNEYMGRLFFTAGVKVYLSYKMDKEEEPQEILPILIDILVSLF